MQNCVKQYNMGIDNSEKIFCSKCNSILASEKDRCSYCGSKEKTIKLAFIDSNEIYEQFKFKAKDKTKNKKKNPILDVFQGVDIRRSTCELVHKKKEIDKINDSYYEHIDTFGGTVIHHCEEKLTAHYGHGSAKYNKIKK